MIIKHIESYWTNEIARNHPQVLFIFTDNNEKKGKSGYASVRNEPNAIGIPCRKYERLAQDSFYLDINFEDNRRQFDEILMCIFNESSKYKEIWFPAHLFSEMTFQVAPKTFAYLNERLKSLKATLS